MCSQLNCGILLKVMKVNQMMHRISCMILIGVYIGIIQRSGCFSNSETAFYECMFHSRSFGATTGASVPLTSENGYEIIYIISLELTNY